MEIYWRKKRLREQVYAVAASNPITARRMIAIQAASNFTDLEPPCNGRAHFLRHEWKNHFALDLESKKNGRRLICIPVGAFEVRNDQYVKETITAFEVIKIEDYH